MSQQKALLLMAKHSPFEIKEVDVPKPGPGDLLVKVVAAALNPVDWKVQKYGILRDMFPAILGADIAGIVEEVGEGVTTFGKGDKVFHQASLFENEKAAFQEYAIVPAEIVAKLPNNISFDQACSIPLCIGTAAVGFYNPTGCNGAGMTPPWESSGEGKYKDKGILIFGGSTSTGQYATQFARLSGFSPIAVTASLHNAGLVKSLGATHVIDRKADVVAEASKIFSTPPGFVFDAISEDTQEVAWKILARNGTLALVLPVSPKLNAGEDGKTVFTVFGNLHVNRDLGRGLFCKLTELVESDKIKPNPVEVLPGGLTGIDSGLKRMSENQISGLKLIVRPPETP